MTEINKKSFQKKVNNLSPEKEWIFEVNTPYEFTINFNDQYQKYNVVNRHMKIKKQFEEILDEYDMYYYLLPEISMPQFAQNCKSPRIHYHGIIMFKTRGQILNYLVYTAQKLSLIGRYQFNKYREKYWNKYINKHQQLFSKLEIELINHKLEDFITNN